MGGVVKFVPPHGVGDLPPGTIIEIGPRSNLFRFPDGRIEAWHDNPNSRWRDTPEILAGDGGIETWRG